MKRYIVAWFVSQENNRIGWLCFSDKKYRDKEAKEILEKFPNALVYVGEVESKRPEE